MTGIVNSSGDTPHDEVLKEVEEIDWTEDLNEYAPSDEAVEDFDVGELECVDEEDDDRRVQEVQKPSSSRSHKEHRSSGERLHPYSRQKTIRDVSDSPRRGKHSPARISRDRRRKMEWLERKRKEWKNGGQEDINMDELEEVDCCDDDDVRSDTTSSFSGDTPSSTSQLLDDDIVDDDPWAKRISQADTSVFSLDDDDDFPSLCEDLDAEVLKRAAQDTTEQQRNHREKSPSVEEEKNEPPPMADSTTSPPEAIRRSPNRERVERILPAKEERRGAERRESRRSLYEKRRKVEEEDSDAVNSTTGRRQHETPHAPRRVESYATGLPLSEGKRRRTSGSRTERKEEEKDVPVPTSAQIRNLLRQLDARDEEIRKRSTEQKRPNERKQSFPEDRQRIRVRPQQPMRRSYL